MKTDTFQIDGPVLFSPRRFEDARGYFMETFRRSVFDDSVGEPVEFVQDNQSLSRRKGTVRGLHYQSPPHAQGKLVRCIQGAIVDIAVDVRRGSATYGQHVRAELTQDNARQLWVPPGFLHGFSTLTDDVVVHYKCSDYYAAGAEGSVVWNDPDLSIDWGVDAVDAVVSQKDAAAPAFDAFQSPF
ncbi:dTDP-4-dehydrorhamnose 3,5-epimerase [uncultured Algimonas sp.]|uniref:dTDP-4-dehydrorhamnose 3,5-epimerase n=1 Tax=uncultured Algimonas sp. TaxID=1547920 RepID=UPI002631714F|nr:dTDP-4-dehydrorhamnose 3,5-epimerase [uncultured Algimonas sp.]